MEAFCNPKQLWFLFSHTLLNVHIHAIELFNDYQEDLSADYFDEFDSPIIVVQKCLLDISYQLSSQSARLSDFSLRKHESKVDGIYLKAAEFAHRQPVLSARTDWDESLLLEEQFRAYYKVLKAIDSIAKGDNISHKCFFLDGKAGWGKTFTVNVLVNRLQGRGNIVIISGLIALSVTLYEPGQTVHSTFGIPIIEVKITILFLLAPFLQFQ